MADVRALAEVRLWGRTVGAVAELDSGRVVFELDPGYARTGPEISPLRLPLSRTGPRTFDELRRSPAFLGLPGVLADALPDAFGNKVIRAWFTARGREQEAFSPVQRLLYVGARAIGALTFSPALDLPLRAAEEESLRLSALAADARAIVEGAVDVAVAEIYRIGSSAGGMRPKAVVLYDPTTGHLRSGHASPRPGEIEAILKLDGVGDGASTDALGVPLPFNRIEAAYMRMARDAGIDAARVDVLEADGYAHLVVHRFDHRDGVRLHQHTLGGLLHVDYNEPGASSYEEYLRAVLALGMAQASVDEGYRRMAFNVLAVNQDDHVKNLSFHMGQDGAWSLAPAYDLTYASGAGWTARHQMRVQDDLEGITAADLSAVAKRFGVRKHREILERIRGVLDRWEAYADGTGVPGSDVARVRATLDERRRSLAG